MQQVNLFDLGDGNQTPDIVAFFVSLNSGEGPTELYLNGSFMGVGSSEQQQLDPNVFTLLDASGVAFASLTMGKNIYLRGRIVDTAENSYIVDFSNVIQGVDNKSLVRFPKTRRIEN